MKTACIASLAALIAAAHPAVAQPAPPPTAAAAIPDDEATIRAIVASQEADQPDPHLSAHLDWENAFGIRYTDLKKRDAFYGAVVKPQFKTATGGTLEVKVRFVTADVAVADSYWRVVGQVYAGETKPGPDRWGRTTYIFEKQNGSWTEVIERVADLRLPYYKHLDTAPIAAPVPASLLASYAGHYIGGKYPVDVTVKANHLVLTGPKGDLIAVPTSQSDFLVFLNSDDVAEYYKLRFSVKDGITAYTLSEAWGEELSTHQKQP